MLATANTGEIWRGFRKNAGEWTASVEINREEIPDSKRSMYGYRSNHKGLLQALKGERLSSVFSPDGTLISASATPHCGAAVYNTEEGRGDVYTTDDGRGDVYTTEGEGRWVIYHVQKEGKRVVYTTK